MASVCQPKIRLAIIGAGAAGLAVARYSLSQPNLFTTTIFEQHDRLGGTWVYDPNYPHSSMYASLKTNLPKEVMPFLDFPFPSEYSSFMSHEQVLKYLNDYAQFHNILPYVEFTTCVETISPSNEKNSKWLIKTNNSPNFRHFDAVAVCNGHYSKPRVPKINDLDKFKGKVIHSHSYKEPKSFSGKKVICFGVGPSGIDISAEIATVASHVYLSHNKPFQPNNLMDNLTNVAPVESADQNGFVLKDGTYISCDVFIFCTGYDYEFPFLTPECGINVTGEYVTPLYKHLININHPTMAFLGIPFIVCPFPMVDLQAQFFISYLKSEISLPDKDEMVKLNEELLKVTEEKEKSMKFVHRLGDDQWSYFDDLAQVIKCSKIPLVIRKIYEQVWENRFRSSPNYRNFNYEVLDTDNFRQY